MVESRIDRGYISLVRGTTLKINAPTVFSLTDCDTSDDLSNGSKAQVGTLKLDLPVDEDDYLMPSPANDEIDHKRRHGPANYIDLIGHQHTEGMFYIDNRP